MADLGEYRLTLRPAGWRTVTALAAGTLVCVGAVMAWAEASWVLRLLLAWVLLGAVIGALAAMASCDRRTLHFFRRGDQRDGLSKSDGLHLARTIGQESASCPFACC